MLGLGGKMALLIVISTSKSARADGATFASSCPISKSGFPEVNDLREIEYLAFIRPDFGAIRRCRTSRRCSAARRVEAFINHPNLPKCPLGKIEPSGGDR